jgi:hypothetical protein
MKRMVLQINMGTDIRGADHAKAAVRALRDAVWHHSLTVADALGQEVDAVAVQGSLKGGLDAPDETSGDIAVIANATATVRLDLTGRQT